MSRNYGREPKREPHATGPSYLNLEDARTFAGALDLGVVRVSRKEVLSGAEHDFIWGVTTQGAAFIVNLINTGNQMPPAREVGRHLHMLANADKHLFVLSPAFDDHDIGTPSLDATRQMLQEHEGNIREYPNALQSSHRVNIEDSAIAVAHLIGGFVESNSGLRLDGFGREHVAQLARLHEAAFPSESN